MIATTSAVNDSKCSLFSLPPELRLKVYRFLMINHEDHLEPGIIEVRKIGSAAFLIGYNFSSQLLRVCSRVCDEAMPVLYGENTFVADGFHGLRRAPLPFDANTRDHIRSIGIEPVSWPTFHNPHLLKFPPLPALKTVRLMFTGTHLVSDEDRVSKGEKLITELITTRPGDGNWLTKFMDVIDNPNQAQWILDVKTKGEKWRPATHEELVSDDFLPLSAWVTELKIPVPVERIHISVKATIVEVKDDDGETKKKWHFVNTLGNTTVGVAENQIAVMRKDLTVAKPELKLLRTIEF